MKIYRKTAAVFWRSGEISKMYE